MSFTFENNVCTTLASSVATGASTIIVNMVTAPHNDPPTPASEARITLMDNLNNPGAVEVISYTGTSVSASNSTIALTGVTKGLEGTSDQAWAGGDGVIQTLTKEAVHTLPYTDSDAINAVNNEVYGLILCDTAANRPAAGIAERFFWATDERILYQDDGSAWNRVLGNPISLNKTAIDQDWTLLDGYNGLSVGPLQLDAKVTLNGIWKIV